MVQFLNMPAFQASPLLDLSPIAAGLAQRQKAIDAEAKRAQAQAKMDEDKRQFDAGNARLDAGESREAALAPLRRRALEAQATAAERGPTTNDITEYEYARKRGYGGSLTDFQKQQHLNRLGPKSELDAEIANLVRGMGQGQQQGQPPPEQGQSPIRPQSYQGGDDPMLVPTQAGGGQPAPQQQPPAPELIDTPAGRMTAENARKMSFVLGLAGKGDAGKMLMEESNRTALGKEARNEIDKQEVGAINSLGRLREIARGFKPEFQTYEGSIQNFGVGILDSIGAARKNIPPAVAEKHIEFTSYKRDAMAFLTEGIKNATGAAMGIQEEGRIRAGLPDPEKDGPTAFQAKLKSTVRDLEMGVARTRYLRKNGFNGSPFTGDKEQAANLMPLGSFSRMIESDTRKLYQQMRQQNPNVDDGEIKRGVRQQIRGKYGLDT